MIIVPKFTPDGATSTDELVTAVNQLIDLLHSGIDEENFSASGLAGDTRAAKYSLNIHTFNTNVRAGFAGDLSQSDLDSAAAASKDYLKAVTMYIETSNTGPVFVQTNSADTFWTEATPVTQTHYQEIPTYVVSDPGGHDGVGAGANGVVLNTTGFGGADVFEYLVGAAFLIGTTV